MDQSLSSESQTLDKIKENKKERKERKGREEGRKEIRKKFWVSSVTLSLKKALIYLINICIHRDI